ncbi:carbonate dehydratase [Motilimonas pumila]|uniref:Carbonic anhydrase n=1 Tax=Motilimonas pumila TaxID=2303987 RepID=A0A418YFA2_9GAMM|nr:carbonate dehydratase [Motilimonas pumila]RJG47940.1 carbonate dehydratase [Motilimonas pumila]
MDLLEQLLINNAEWAEQIKAEDPTFFETLAAQQAPEYLWIGCSDSRVPANQLLGLLPGDIFVHRNIANQVVHTDLNCLSVIQYAVDVLQVKHIIVTGHYGCGGIKAALENGSHGLIDNWLRNIKDTYVKNSDKFETGMSEEDRLNRMCELNVTAQVENVCHTSIVQKAWQRGQELNVHGWVYSIKDGLIKDTQVTVSSQQQLADIYQYK